MSKILMVEDQEFTKKPDGLVLLAVLLASVQPERSNVVERDVQHGQTMMLSP